MLHPDAYFAQYWEIRQDKKVTPGRAFQMLEKEFFRQYGVRRFRNYDSFRNALCMHKAGRYPMRRIALYIMDDINITDEND